MRERLDPAPLIATDFRTLRCAAGVVFRIERRGPEFLARRISGGSFPVSAVATRSSEQALAATFDKGGAEPVTRLYRRGDLWEDQCWLHAGPGGVGVTTGSNGQIAGVAPRSLPAISRGYAGLEQAAMEPRRQI